MIEFAEISCWMWTGERQSTKMRIKYLEAALNQDIQFFDTEVRTSDVVFAINTDAVMVQDAISEKVKKKKKKDLFRRVTVKKKRLVVQFLIRHFVVVLLDSWGISCTTWLPLFLDLWWGSPRRGS